MVIFIYGEDTFRSRQKLKEFKEKFIREVDPSGNSIVVLNGETANLAKISDAANASSLFSRKRMIVVENVLKNKSKLIQDEIAEYFKKQKTDQENIIIFWDVHSGDKLGKSKLFNFLSKPNEKSALKKFVQPYPVMSNGEILNWTRKEFVDRGGKISQTALYALTGLFGNDLWIINNEINKLINYKKGEEITEMDVREMVKGKINENIFALTDAIGANNKGRALELIAHEIEAGAAETYLLFMIIRQFKIMLQVRVGMDQNLSPKEIASELKIHPFVVQKSFGQVRNFSSEKLIKIISKLIQVDSDMKSGKQDLLTALDLLMVKL